MIDFLLWYLLISLIGWVAFPVAYRFLPGLADRGFSFIRPLGLLLLSFIFWLLNSLHILQNTAGGAITALILVACLSILAARGRVTEIGAWIHKKRGLILFGEVLFAAAFAAWAVVRAANPDISGTEKPMEMAFINSILRSESFPPADPWLSGYAISYYYFGYIMVALLIQLTGVVSSVGFNLAVSLWFGMTAVAASGLVYSLVSWLKTKNEPAEESQNASPAWGLFGPFFVLIAGNLEGFLEILHAKGIFWQKAADGSWTSGFWKWLNILELVNPPSEPLVWMPNRPDGILWWRASRVLQDFDLSGLSKEIIDEFPFFSYLLSDLHPHVLSMPFVLLAAALALNVYRVSNERFNSQNDAFAWLVKPEFWITAVALGALSFLNTWDFPMYVALFCAASCLNRFQEEGWTLQLLWEFLGRGVLLGIAGFMLYLPFYVGFASQAGGLLPSMSFFTQGKFFWVMFGTLLIPVILWLAWLWKYQGSREKAAAGLRIAICLVGGLWLFSFLFGLLIVSLPAIGSATGKLNWVSYGQMFLQLHGVPSGVMLLAGALVNRLAAPGAWLTLGGLLLVVVGLLTRASGQKKEEASSSVVDSAENKSPHTFVLLLVLMGACLALFPEFFYLRDQFGWRMNTIFKFYFQTWIVWGIAAAYASAVLWQYIRERMGTIFKATWCLVILMALAYPLTMVWVKTGGFKPAQWTLDGANFMQDYSKNDYDAIQWLKTAPRGTIAEAVGGSYTGYARVSTFSGQPAVLGWVFHESQWRGGTKEMGTRQDDIQRLYRSSDWNETETILEQYQIRYVYIGSYERNSYRPNESKFENHLKVVYRNDEVVIYEVPSETGVNSPVIR